MFHAQLASQAWLFLLHSADCFQYLALSSHMLPVVAFATRIKIFDW